MNRKVVTISSLIENDFTEVLSLANDTFGEGYISRSILFEYLSEDKRIGLVSRVNGIIVGFSLSWICESNEISSLALSDSK